MIECLNNIADRLFRLLFPPYCIVCKTMLEEGELVLCPKCRLEYEREKGIICPECGKNQPECTCAVGGMRAYHVAPYLKDEGSPSRMMVLTAKEAPMKRLIRFSANEIERMLALRGVKCENYGIAYVPRSAGAVLRYGVDQAEAVAKLLASELGMDLFTPLRHIGAAKQKLLSRDERTENAETSYVLAKNAENMLAGKHIILYDDVVTTGATVISCAELLKRAGAAEVVILSFAKTLAKKNNYRKKSEL